MTDAEKPMPGDMEQALLDPASVFETPEALLLNPDLSREQKIEILRRWEYDASEVSVAVEEGMPDGDDDLLQRILNALGELSASIDGEKTGPTKQHGIPRSAVKSE
jgi:hypothetical protein|tara:strand:+ start:11453 stop:11770 length:318 start_codon:yes stop_codon:yes gene_type:complete